MDVSSASGSSAASAYHHMRHAHRRVNRESGQGVDSSSGTSLTQAQGAPPPGGRPPGGPGGGHDIASVLDQILKGGGGVDDVKAQLQKDIEAFQSSDKFKSLPPEVQQKIQERDSGDNLEKMAQKMVDRYQETGTTKPPERPMGGERAHWMAKLEEQGRAQQAGVYAKFGVGGFAPSAASPDESTTSPAEAEATAGA